ncbi:O-antigen ligase [Microlunatus panaciterrae]|uniref:O-antigen ligase n=1 Tax=Microlunatus panaciterrae TaxID=400768 RepID=A0ABS2RHR6_9ACTN|nr:O-antigen ligase [Microlunatus panaciterrae]
MGDVAVGVIFGILSASNLVQGAWTTQLPWLDLTTASFILAVPATLFALTRRVRLSGFLCLFLLIASVSFGFIEPALGAEAVSKRINIGAAVLFVLAASFLSLSNRRRIKALCVTIVVLAFVVVIGQVVAPDPIALDTGRRTPVGLNAIGSGRAVGAGLVVVLAFAASVRKMRHLLSLSVLALPLALGLYWASSRGPVLGVLVAVVLIVWKQPMLRRSIKVGLLTAGAVVGLIAYRKLVVSGSRLVESSGSGRETLYREALHIASTHPAGVGWGNFYRFVPPALLDSDQGEKLYAHNIILEFWIEAGFAGAILFLVFFVIVMRRGLQQASSTMGIALAALAISSFVGALLSSDIVGNRMMWVVFGAILAAPLANTANGVHQPPPRKESPRIRELRRLAEMPSAS